VRKICAGQPHPSFFTFFPSRRTNNGFPLTSKQNGQRFALIEGPIELYTEVMDGAGRVMLETFWMQTKIRQSILPGTHAEAGLVDNSSLDS
jgi:hypothetical protein